LSWYRCSRDVEVGRSRREKAGSGKLVHAGSDGAMQALPSGSPLLILGRKRSLPLHGGQAGVLAGSRGRPDPGLADPELVAGSSQGTFRLKAGWGGGSGKFGTPCERNAAGEGER